MTRIKTHPGSILREELEARNLSANALARALRVPPNRITEILNQDRGISPDTALRFSRYFETSAEFWMNLQTAHDLSVTEQEHGEKIAADVAGATAA